MFTENTENTVTPVTTTAEPIRLISVVMADDPRELRELGLDTVYKYETTNVLSVSEIAIGRQSYNLSSSDLFSHSASKGYLVLLSMPEDCYDEVLQSLQRDPLITKINDDRTVSGQFIENHISSMIANYTEQESTEHTFCNIM